MAEHRTRREIPRAYIMAMARQRRLEFMKAVGFCAIFVLLLIGVSYAVRMNGEVKDRFVGFYAEKKNTLDAVFIGSSPVYPSVAGPLLYGETGIALYPLSSNMQRPVASLWLTKEVRKTQKPSLMIFEMRMYTARDEDMLGNMAHTREVTDNLRYSINRIRVINAMVPNVSDRRDYYLDIFKYHSNWKTLIFPSQLRTFTYSWPHPLKGYVFLDEVAPAEGTLRSSETYRLPIPEEEERCLLELIDYLDEVGQDALFLVTPHTTKDAEKDAMYRYIGDLVEGRGYTFYNMNEDEAIGIDLSTDFRDYGNHLNAIGSKKLTKYFGAWLTEHYDLPDHRGDKEYSSWDKAYSRWLARYDEAEEKILADKEAKRWWVMESGEE